MNKTLTSDSFKEQSTNIDALENKLFDKNNDYLEKRKNLSDLTRKNRKQTLQQLNQSFSKVFDIPLLNDIYVEGN